MRLYDIEEYQLQLSETASFNLPWHLLRNRSILISGISGMIGSYLTDVLMYKNRYDQLNCKIYGICRDREKAYFRFNDYIDNQQLVLITVNLNKLNDISFDSLDYVVHLASNTHPLLYSLKPIETIMTNITGTQNMLEVACNYNSSRFVFASSNEIYGENKGDAELFDEDYLGYIDCNSLRAGYPESKRCGEALCQAYRKEYDLDVVIPRFTRSYGPTMKETDTKAISQFIKNAVNQEDIVLKSKGQQLYSYTYVADAVTGLLRIMLCGKNGEAYNVAGENSDVTLYDLANKIAKIAGTKVITQIPDEIEQAGYSKATKARLNGNKLRQLGKISETSLDQGLERTIRILRQMKYSNDDETK